MKGGRSTGKTSVTESIIRQFLAESDEQTVVYVGMSSKGLELTKAVNSDRLMTFGVTEDSAASYYLAPELALRVAAE